MVTIVTHVQLRGGAEHEWDAVMRQRLAAAKKQPGLVGGQLLRADDPPNGRVIVGTWRTRADWQGWHEDPRFAEMRRQLDGLERGPAEHRWHEVVLDVRKAATPPAAASKRGRKRASKRK
jgi:heme-degrading monooxygenase HmoA